MTGPDAGRFSLDGRVVLLTGAAGGIGRVFATALAGAGAQLAVHDRSLDELRSTFDADPAASSEDWRPFAADLVRPAECRRLVADVADSFGRIDILVNCAAANRRLSIDEVDEASLELILAVNVRAPLVLSQAVHPIMRDAGGGVIVNVGSLNQLYALSGVSAYGLSKGALAQFTRAAAVEFAPDRIRVNCLVPGFIVTRMNADALWGVPRRRHWILDRTPLGRPGTPDDLVGALLFLASDASAFMTGQTIVVDGGILAGGSWDYQAADADEAAEAAIVDAAGAGRTGARTDLDRPEDLAERALDQ